MLLFDLIIFAIVLSLGNAIVMFGTFKYIMSERMMMKTTKQYMKMIEALNDELGDDFQK